MYSFAHACVKSLTARAHACPRLQSSLTRAPAHAPEHPTTRPPDHAIT